MYEHSDKAIARINRRIQHEFAVLRRSIAAFDEIWRLQDAVNVCYRNILNEAKQCYLEVANNTYKDETDRDGLFSYLWVEQFLLRYDPVTKYVFAHEYDRKRARTFEFVVCTQRRADLQKELKQAMYALSVQTKQASDEITDESTLQAYRDSGVQYVRWVTETDDRVCSECKKRNNKVYAIDKVPPKPHIRCRCRLIPATRQLIDIQT